MPTYIQGLLAAFLEPVFHGGCNIIDQFLSSKIFPRLTTLVFFGSLVTIVLVPVVWWLSPPHWLPLPLIFLAFCIACIEILYLYPYYWSLRVIDTSIVASLFSLGRIFIPLFAFAILGERLAPIQYAGFFLICASSLTLTFDRKKLRFNKAFFLMGFVSLILAVESILYKYAFTHGASWGSIVVPMMLFEFSIVSVLFLATGAFRTLHADFRKVRSVGMIFITNEVFGWAGNMGDSFGVSILPVTVSRAISSTQPLFALFYAYLFKRKRPELFREQLGASDVRKKIALFVLTVIGVVMVLAFGSPGA